MDNLNALVVFVRVAEARSFTAAAERLVRFIVGGLRATLPVAPPKKSSTPPSHRRPT